MCGSTNNHCHTLGFETKVRNLVVQQKVPMEENKRESALHVSKQGICTCEIEYNGNYCGSCAHGKLDFVFKVICLLWGHKVVCHLEINSFFFLDTKLSCTCMSYV